MPQLANGLGLSRSRFSGGGFVGPLDDYESDLAVAWSTTARLLSSYAGPLIRVRRSTDNAELDIGSAANGARDDAALTAFVGAGSGFISVVYDQSAAEINTIQETASLQPRIVNAGTLETNGMRSYTGQYVRTDSLASSNFAGATAVQLVAKVTIQTGAPNGRLFDFGTGSEISAWLPFGSDVYWDAPQATARINAALPVGTIGNQKTFSFERSGADQQVVINNSVLVASSAASGSISATAHFPLGADGFLNPGWLGWIDTVAIWKTTTDAAGRRQALE